MKSYLCAFLFLLLVEKSPSARVLPSTMDNIQHKFSPTQPNEPPPKIKGLSLVKEYYSDFGFLQSSGPFNDYMDEETITATKTYQQYFNLQVTGYLNDETFQQISLPRCGVPDMNFNYGFTDNASWPKAGNRWFPERNHLTYGFDPASDIQPNMIKVFRDAFERWAQVTTGVLRLTETTYDKADIKVGFRIFNNIWDLVFSLSFIILQPGSNVTTGDIRLNSAKLWSLPSENESQLSWEDGVLDLESAAMHQIGHLLGLDHSNKEDSVMYPNVLPSQQRKVELSVSDMENIQRHYTNGNSGHSGRWGVLLITTLSLGIWVYELIRNNFMTVDLNIMHVLFPQPLFNNLLH